MKTFDLSALTQGAVLESPSGQATIRATEETHSGFVALTDDLALKFRKPVDLGFLNYSNAERRRAALTTEWQLGVRLSPTTYVGMWSTTDGTRFLESDEGEAVLVMSRLPASSRMDLLLRNGGLTPAHLRRVVQRLAAIHRAADADRNLDGWGRVANTREAWEVNFEQMPGGAADHPFVQDEFARLRRDTAAWLDGHLEVLESRIRDGFIRDGHGDLRPEHIYLTNPVQLIDPLEFSTALRFADVGAEIGYLAMECEFEGRHDISRMAIEWYAEELGDETLTAVVGFFQRYRALVMAKVEWIRAGQQEGAAKASHLGRARRYAELALSTELV